MSCWMMNEKGIAQIADYIGALYEVGYNYFGYDMPDSLKRELWDCHTKYGGISRNAIYKKLYDLNMSAYCGRYRNESYVLPGDMPETAAMYHPRGEGLQQWHFDLLKHLSCFNYQCCEDPVVNTALYKALRDLENVIKEHIISELPQYKAAAWG